MFQFSKRSRFKLAWYQYYYHNEAEIKSLLKLLDQRAGLNWIENGIVEAIKGTIFDFMRLIWIFWIIWKILNPEGVVVTLHSDETGVNPTVCPTFFEARLDTNSEARMQVTETESNESILIAD